jgi:hypothetical protein
MTPDVSTDWVDEESLPEGRVMGKVVVKVPDRVHRVVAE